jgi:signal transduction histidine kinase/AraC-like DNA-binding protein
MAIKVLVVDDEVYMEKLIKMRFRREISKKEYVFQYALNGQDALHWLQENKEIDIVLCDINMPVMDGLALLDHLAQHPSPLKVIMVTAYGNMNNIRAAMNRGAFDFINKPIDIPDLKTTIDKAAKELDQIKEGEEARKQLPITQKVLAETDEKARHLEELNQFKNQFFTNISHEFRTPLTVIRGMLGQIDENPDRWLEKGKKLIRRNTNQLLDLVNQILDLQKLESGKLDLKLIQGDIVAFLNYLSESFHSLAEQKGVSVSFEASPDEIWMDYDAEKVLRIFSNLFSNAIKFTPEGGNIDIKITLNSGLKNENKSLVFSIKDTGIGIPEEKLPSIFDRFYQVDGSATREGEGTGIGLSLTQELVQLMSGKITVESKTGEGTTFTISLPVTNEAPKENNTDLQLEQVIASVPSVNDAEIVPNSSERKDLPSLLIIEDNKDVAEYMVTCLQDDYALSVARDGEEGIKKALSISPDLIISDVMMPRKDGFEVCNTLKNDDRTSHIPIVLLTAKADHESRIQGLRKGADTYLAKPFNKEELSVILENLLELRKKLQSRYANKPIADLDDSIEFQQEDEFLKRIYAYLDENISHTAFSVPALCKHIGMSRSNLHRKVKALTGESIGELVKKYQLKKAEYLLKNTDQSISDIGYQLGFNDPSYFSRRFTQEYGFSPRQMREG